MSMSSFVRLYNGTRKENQLVWLQLCFLQGSKKVEGEVMSGVACTECGWVTTIRETDPPDQQLFAKGWSPVGDDTWLCPAHMQDDNDDKEAVPA